MPQHAENTCFAERVAPSWVGPDDECVTSLHAALERYLELMYDCDVSRFDDVFAPTVQLHGLTARCSAGQPQSIGTSSPSGSRQNR
jgi:hypothetical protein